MRRRGMALLAVCCAALAGCGSMERVEIEDGYRGKARLNPFLAAWRLMEQRGWVVEERHGLTTLPGNDQVVIVSARSDESGLAAEELAKWIKAGGHAVYLLAGADRFAPELDREPDKETEDAPPEKDENRKEAPTEVQGEEAEGDEDTEPVFPLLEVLELRIEPRPGTTRACRIAGRKMTIEMPPGLGVKGVRRSEGVIRSQDKGPAGLVSLPLEKGRITVVGDAWIWRNRHIGKLDHASLFWEVMRLHGEPAGVWLLSDTRISFFALLWNYGWMALTGLALFVISWLWRSMPRFGPLLPDPPPASRDFVGHLFQVGAFLWSRGGAQSLVTPLRQSLMLRLARHGGEGEAGTLTVEQWESLAHLTGLSVDRLRHSLTGEIPRQRRHFVELMTTLQIIASACP